MKTITFLFVLGVIFTTLSSCTTSSLSQKQYRDFKNRPDYQKTREVYRDETLLKSANSSNTKIRINLTDQRAQMIVGDRGHIAIDTPCCTGKSGKRTPTGDFTITSKIPNKRSSIFGNLYRNGRHVYRGDRRKYRGRYNRYIGASLPYWMRLTHGGIGMHYSAHVHRYPGSNGCIRMPRDAVKTIYANSQIGTQVQIVQ